MPSSEQMPNLFAFFFLFFATKNLNLYSKKNRKKIKKIDNRVQGEIRMEIQMEFGTPRAI